MKEILAIKSRVYQPRCISSYLETWLFDKIINSIEVSMKRSGIERLMTFIAGLNISTSSGSRIINKLHLILSVLFLSFIFSSAANAHRGARNEVDTCRFSVGDEIIHFSAYTPTFSAGTSYCHGIPNIGLTHLVFDYEGSKLRHTTVEFEITKEPEGTRIYYHEPEKIKKGSIDAKVDFTEFGAGDYLAHVTIMYKGEKLDSHLPFSIGVDPEEGGIPTVIIVMMSLVAIVIFGMVIMSRIKGK